MKSRPHFQQSSEDFHCLTSWCQLTALSECTQLYVSVSSSCLAVRATVSFNMPCPLILVFSSMGQNSGGSQ